MKKQISFWLLLVLSVAAVLMSSCKEDEKEEEKVNPYATQITALVADSASQAAAVRAAVEPAKTDPYNITTLFNDRFHAQETTLGITATTLPDSAKVLANTVDALQNEGLTLNQENLNVLKTKSNTYTATIASLADLRAKAKAAGY